MHLPAQDADAIRANGWRQGSLLQPVDLPLPRKVQPHFEILQGAYFYVLTHDCDLVQPDFGKEPSVEVLVISPIEKIDGNFAHGRHPRTIDFQIGADAFRANCHTRHTFQRSILAGIRPVNELTVEDYTRDVISEWISKRYIRPAFPDEFNRRLHGRGKAIQKFLKDHGSRFWQILISCNPSREELPANEKYDLLIWLVEDPNLKESVDEEPSSSLAKEFGKIIEGCPGIQLNDCRMVTEEDVTLGHTRIFSAWDFDYLSHREVLGN